MGFLHEQLGNFEEAKEYHELSLSIRQKKLGPENVKVATSYHNLDLVHDKLGDFEKGKEYHELALCINQKMLRPVRVHDVSSRYQKSREAFVFGSTLYGKSRIVMFLLPTIVP